MTASLLQFLTHWYGPDNPSRGWLIGFTVCVLALLFKNTRRFGGIGLFVVAGAMCVATFIRSAYQSYTPQ